MYYKIISDGAVIDASDGLMFVRWQEKNSMLLGCSEEEATGFVTSTGKAYLLEGAPPLDGFSIASFVETSAEEAALIMAAIEDGRELTVEDMDIFQTGSVELIREGVIRKMSAACNAAIVAGVDVLIQGTVCHFSLDIEDQLNMISLQGMLAAGAETVPYHADGQECRFFTAEEFSRIAAAATAWKIYQESYFNSLRAYIMTMTDIGILAAVTYGMNIPEEFQTDVLKHLLAGGR